MKTAISKNKKTSTILNKLIENGFYNGIIDDDKFELTGTYPNYLKITGQLNDKENYDLYIEHHFAIIYLTRFLFLIGTIFSILYAINGIWIPLFFLIILSIFELLSSKYAERKAIKLFHEKFFEIEKREFER